MKLALTLGVILGLAIVSQAAIVQTINEISVDVTLDTVTPSTTAGTIAYTVTLSSPVGMYSFDGRVDAFAGAYLNQAWYTGTLATPMGDGATASLTVTNRKNDSRILLPSTNLVASRLPDENFVLTTAPYGRGTTLCGAFVAGYNQVDDGEGGLIDVPYNDWSKTMADGFGSLTNYNSIAFARLVVPNTLTNVTLVRPSSGDYVEFNYRLVDGQARDGQFNIFLAPVPEPVTLSLVAAGALALIRRRR